MRVLDRLPRELEKVPPFHQRAAFFLPEVILLAIRGVPDPVHEQVGDVECSQPVAVPPIHRRSMVGKEQRAMAVRQRHSREVPEDQQESPFLVVHVPTMNQLEVCSTLALPLTTSL